MIEINLIPDVKRELLKAQRQRSMVISGSIIAGVIAIIIAGILLIWWTTQGARNYFLDQAIESEHQKLASVEDVNDTITIQNQLSKVSSLHTDKSITSRLFNVVAVISPSKPDNITINNLTLNGEDRTIKIEASTEGGYASLEVFKKTIENTKLVFNDDTEVVIPLAEEIYDGERLFSDNAGQKILRFTLTFKYPQELFGNNVKTLTIKGPERTNVTDSYLGVPQSIFGEGGEE